LLRWAGRWCAPKPWQTNAALLGLGAGLVGFSVQFLHEAHHYSIGFSGVSSAMAVLYLAAVAILLAFPANTSRYTFPIVLAVALACRLVVLFPAPFLSTDVYRYVWDGIVQHAHISPYRYVPADPALSFLRAPHQGIYDHINRRDYARTIYPPAAQVLFFLVSWISPTVTAMKAAMVVFECITIAALLRLFGPLGIPRERILVYAWCPLTIWEFAGNGHLDAAAMALIVLALLFRYRRNPVLTGVFLALAILTKLYPAVLLPALYQRGKDDGKLPGWTMPATVAAMMAAFYGIYLSAGKLVFGFAGGYVKEEGMDSGTRFFLLELAQRIPGLHSLPNAAFLAFAAAVFLGLTVWAWRTGCRQGSPPAAFLAPAFAFAIALMLLFSPHYPWYIAWLIPFLVLLPNLPIFTYVCGFFYLCTTAMAVGYGPQQFLLNEYLYGFTALAGIIAIAIRMFQHPRSV
jgi:hypothetical protein